MKTKNKLSLLAVTAAVLSLSGATGVGQVFSPADAINNRAVAASPRAKEAFPWLTRTAAPRTDACCDKGEVKNALTAAQMNRAYAASPRVREMFPELGLTPTQPREFTIAPLVEKNPGVFTNPRAKEQFPELRFLSPATAKGGASKLMEFRK
jgi:hypothetical protein